MTRLDSQRHDGESEKPPRHGPGPPEEEIHKNSEIQNKKQAPNPEHRAPRTTECRKSISCQMGSDPTCRSAWPPNFVNCRARLDLA